MVKKRMEIRLPDLAGAGSSWNAEVLGERIRCYKELLYVKIRPIRAPFNLPVSGKPRKNVRFDVYKNGGHTYPRSSK
jgi:hypothetical protein